MKRSASVLVLGFLWALPAAAHDFWIQPEQYWAQPDVSIPVTLQVGHGSEQQRSQIRASRISRFMTVGPDGKTTDARADLHLHGLNDDGRVRLRAPGTHIVALETDLRGRSTLSAQRFNEHIATEGLTAAFEQRERTKRTSAPASESYRRVTKALVQIRAADARPQPHVTKPLGLPLEIVPERNPYDEPHADDLPVRVLFEGQPLTGALVKLTQLEHDETPRQSRRTDESGRASFRWPESGTWLLNVVWTKPVSPPAEVDFETTFSSLSFGFPAAPASHRRQP